MKQIVPLLALSSLTLAGNLSAKEENAPKASEVVAQAAAEAAKPEEAPKDPALEAKRKEQETLSIENKLEAERLLQSTNATRAEVARLKLERELVTEKLALDAAKRQAALQDELAKGLDTSTQQIDILTQIPHVEIIPFEGGHTVEAKALVKVKELLQ